MSQLYEVRIRQYKAYYVIANGYDEAKSKVEQLIIEENNESILTEDGSLKDFKLETIFEIRCLTDNLIL